MSGIFKSLGARLYGLIFLAGIGIAVSTASGVWSLNVTIHEHKYAELKRLAEPASRLSEEFESFSRQMSSAA